MVKVLYVVPEGQDLGGIVTSSENLMIGFKEAGHKATFCLLRHGNSRDSAPRGKHVEEYRVGEGTGLMMHPVHGWRGESMSTARPEEFIALARQHDVVVWGALYGLRNKHTEGQIEWVRCITDHGVPQVFMVRDDHMEDRVPWAMSFASYAAAWAGVQRCSYDSCEGLGAPRALVFSGHGPAMRPTFIRKNRAVAVATWKPWKKGRAMLRAAVHTSMPLVVAGDGIEFRYMRSPDKARSRDFEPDGTRVWDNAIKAGVAYRGCVTEDERDKLLSSSRFMLDMSLRFNSGQLNRVVVEAMRFGAVPIIDPRFVGSLLVENFNYLPMLADDDPRDIGAALNKMSIIKPSVLDKIREANYDLVDMFSRRTAAMALVNLGLGKKAGHTYDKSPIVNHDKLAYGQASFKEIFGAR